MSLWSLDNPVFASYVWFAGVLALKMLLMIPLTGYYRLTKKVFMNPEDAKKFGVKEKSNDPDVERVRRIHQNDLENIPVFWILGLLYVLTQPSPGVAKYVFLGYTISRVQYTVLYLKESGMRGIAFMAGLAVQFFMALTVLYTFW